MLRRSALIVLAAVALAAAMPVHAQGSSPVILVVGDSISAAYGLPPNAGWTDLLAARLTAQKYAFRVVNASISGDTTAGGRSRLPLGGNDGLRGGDLATTRANLDAMAVAAKDAGAKVLIVGMRLPPNYGPAYTNGFAAMFGEVAKARGAAVVPFFFEGFGDNSEWFQPDRIHPTRDAQTRLLDNVWPTLKPLLGNPR